LDLTKDEELMRRLKLIGRNDLLLNDNLIDMGFESYCPILNIGGLIFQYVFLAILVLLSILIKIVLISMNYKYKTYDIIAKKLYDLDHGD
jgi:hypothetical protein